MMELSTLKRERDLLLGVLGQSAPGQHLHCPLHTDKMGSLSINQASDGVWLWKCHAGCGGGTIIDAAMLVYRLPDCRSAVLEIEKQMGMHIGRDEEYQEPRIDLVRAERFVVVAHDLLLNDFEIQEKWLLGKRGISNLDMIKRYRIGFIENARFAGKNWNCTGWVLPIGNPLNGVKLHLEERPWPDGPKCLWAPFGTYPANKPRHGSITLWPSPEKQQRAENLYLCPGELKALALVGAGFWATSLTTGENNIPPRIAARLTALRPQNLAIMYDDDDAGRKWNETVRQTFKKTGISILSFHCGQVVELPLQKTVVPDTMLQLETQWKSMQNAPLSVFSDNALSRPYHKAPHLNLKEQYQSGDEAWDTFLSQCNCNVSFSVWKSDQARFSKVAN